MWGSAATITSSSFPQRSRVRNPYPAGLVSEAHRTKGLGPNLTPSHLLNFVKAGGNILVALSSTTPASTSITQLLSELDVTLPAERTGTVVDHFNYDIESAAQAHDVLVLDAPTTLRPAVKDLFAMPGAVLALPRTAGHVLGQSKLLTPLLRAPSTAYSYNPKEHFAAVDPDELFAAGQQLVLASALQSENSARVAILGSVEMLQDAWMDAKVVRVGGSKTKPENREFAKRLTGWAFQETGVLRVNSIEHRMRGQNETNPVIYRIKNDVVSWHSAFPHFTVIAADPCLSRTAYPSPSTRGISGCPSHCPTVTVSSLNSPCCPPFIGSTWCRHGQRRRRLSLARTSPCPTNTAFSTSWSTTSDHW